MEPAGGRRGLGGARPSPPPGGPGGGGGREASPTAPPLPGGASPSPARAVSKKLGRKGKSLSASDTGEALGPARLPRCRRRRARLTLLRAAAAAAAAAAARAPPPPLPPPPPPPLPPPPPPQHGPGARDVTAPRPLRETPSPAPSPAAGAAPLPGLPARLPPFPSASRERDAAAGGPPGAFRDTRVRNWEAGEIRRRGGRSAPKPNERRGAALRTHTRTHSHTRPLRPGRGEPGSAPRARGGACLFPLAVGSGRWKPEEPRRVFPNLSGAPPPSSRGPLPAPGAAQRRGTSAGTDRGCWGRALFHQSWFFAP